MFTIQGYRKTLHILLMAESVSMYVRCVGGVCAVQVGARENSVVWKSVWEGGFDLGKCPDKLVGLGPFNTQPRTLSQSSSLMTYPQVVYNFMTRFTFVGNF